MRLLTITAMLLSFFSNAAAAEEPVTQPIQPSAGQAQGKSEDVPHKFSLTLSPIHLILPVAEMTGEFRLMDKLGVAAVLGFGSMDASKTSFWVLELGGQVRWYPVGTFIHGMQLGFEAMYVEISGDNVQGSGASGVGQGMAMGPFLGYKIAANVGFTFEIQGGAAMMFARASAAGSSASAVDFGPIVNINLGWSF